MAKSNWFIVLGCTLHYMIPQRIKQRKNDSKILAKKNEKKSYEIRTQNNKCTAVLSSLYLEWNVCIDTVASTFSKQPSKTIDTKHSDNASVLYLANLVLLYLKYSETIFICLVKLTQKLYILLFPLLIVVVVLYLSSSVCMVLYRETRALIERAYNLT